MDGALAGSSAAPAVDLGTANNAGSTNNYCTTITAAAAVPTTMAAATPTTITTEFSCLHISTTTWARDSHELFDYEARLVYKKAYYVKHPSKVFRNTLDVHVIPDGHALPEQTADYLLSIRQREGRYVIVPGEKNVQRPPGAPPLPPMIPKRVWVIVKELPRGHHQLQETDVIRLGRFKLRVKQLVKSGPSTPELHLDEVATPHSIVTPEEAVTMQCRICLLDGGTVDDPLVCPCQCKGSIKFVHVDCLRQWIHGRLSLTDDNQSSCFFFKQLQCELCKTPFPSAVIMNGDRVPIVKVPKIEAPFMILENMGEMNRGLHVVSMENKKELKLGRGHESDVRIADVSISRYHATIRFADGEFILEDHNSKFGTLVSLRKMQPVESSHPLALQVGRTVLNFSLKTPPCDFDEVLKVLDDPLLSTPDTDEDEGGAPENSSSGVPPRSSNNTGGSNANNNNMTNNNETSAADDHPQSTADNSNPPPASAPSDEEDFIRHHFVQAFQDSATVAVAAKAALHQSRYNITATTTTHLDACRHTSLLLPQTG